MESYNQKNNIFSIPHMLNNKKKVELTKVNKNIYKLESLVENKNIYLEKLINFEIIHLFYKVNMDYFEVVEFEILNDNEAILFVLLKPILKELGVQPRYVNLKITKKTIDSSVHFICSDCSDFIKNTKKYNTAIKSGLLNVNIICRLINPHLLYITETVTFDDTYNGFAIMETFLSHMLKVILKQTIKAVEQINYHTG